MENSSERDSKFKEGDRVVRAGTKGPQGTVQKVRLEIVRTTLKRNDQEEPAVTVSVLWDNGTISHFVPGGLDAA